jgi:hypothetical protein
MLCNIISEGEGDTNLPNRMLRSRFIKFFKEPKNRFQGINTASPCSLAGRYDDPTPTRFLHRLDCLKIRAQDKLIYFLI